MWMWRRRFFLIKWNIIWFSSQPATSFVLDVIKMDRMLPSHTLTLAFIRPTLTMTTKTMVDDKQKQRSRTRGRRERDERWRRAKWKEKKINFYCDNICHTVTRRMMERGEKMPSSKFDSHCSRLRRNRFFLFSPFCCHTKASPSRQDSFDFDDSISLTIKSRLPFCSLSSSESYWFSLWLSI